MPDGQEMTCRIVTQREMAILDAGEITRPDPLESAQRARGTLWLTAKPGAVAGTSALADLRHSGCLKALFPRGPQDRLSAVFVNTSGGITGGDDLRIEAAVSSGSRLSLTSQAAERIYRSSHGAPGIVRTRISVAQGARLDWLPQETILYDRASLDRSLRVDLQGDGCCLLVETLVFGRGAMGETIRDISLSDRIAVWRDGTPLFVDRTRLSGNAALHLERRAIAGGGIAIATVLLATAPDKPDAGAHLNKLRPTLPAQAGISLIRPGLLLLRLLAPDSFILRQTLLPVLAQLNDGPLPRTWMI